MAGDVFCPDLTFVFDLVPDREVLSYSTDFDLKLNAENSL